MPHSMLSTIMVNIISVPGIDRGTPVSYHMCDTSIHRSLHSATETPDIVTDYNHFEMSSDDKEEKRVEK